MTSIQRRHLLAGAASLALPAIVRAQAASAQVVVVGGGFGGATAATKAAPEAPRPPPCAAQHPPFGAAPASPGAPKPGTGRHG